MKATTLAIGMAMMLLVPTTASAMTDAECTAAWVKADANKDGVLSESEASRYYAALRVAQKPVADGKLTQADFLTHCRADMFMTAAPVNGAPLAGANSFTETQARDRAAAAGFGTVSAMKKDDSGIWRGTAQDGAKPVKIAVDYKGNVVAN